MAVNAPSRDTSPGSRNQRSERTRTPEPTETPNPPASEAGRPRGDHDQVEVGPAETGRSSVGELIGGMADWAGLDGSSEANASPDASSAPESGPSPLELGENELLSRGRGSSPEKVTQVQEMLNGQGMNIAVDGIFGPETQNAVREFQRQHNLQVDGIVGPQTQGALNGLLNGAANDQTPATPGETPDANDQTPETPGETPDANRQTPESPGQAGALQGIPPRSEDALGGREFLESIRGLPPGPERDRAILNEVLSGNIPDASRLMREVTVERDGSQISYQAMPDYLAIGSNNDNVRIPMTPGVAQAIADRTGTSLPTEMMVDDIHNISRQVHMPALSHDRSGIGSYITHDRELDGLGIGNAQTDFVSGHKKDLVIPHQDGRVAIYGARWADGSRIQGYSNVHGAGYEDYSHGLRLVGQDVTIDGETISLSDALADPQLRSLFTGQGGLSRY